MNHCPQRLTLISTFASQGLPCWLVEALACLSRVALLSLRRNTDHRWAVLQQSQPVNKSEGSDQVHTRRSH